MNSFSKSLFSTFGLILLLTAPVYGQSDPKVVKQVVATIDADGVQRVSILGGGYFYDPNYIVVKVNVPVEFTIKRESGAIPHDFVIKALEAGIDVKISMETKPQVVKFTPTKLGKYPFICSKKVPFFKSHKDKGMEGTLEVTE